METNLLMGSIQSTFNELYLILSQFDEDELNRTPFEGSWTAGQVTDHIIKAVKGVPALCDGSTQEANRQPDAKVEDIKALFLDFTIRMQSPEFILPTEDSYTKDDLYASLKRIENNLTTMIQTQDLTRLCLDSELPGFGLLTRYEWIYFGIIHTQRHIQQLKNILSKLKVKG
ncbi:DinB family protein [Pedobacter sp. BS3]|uniref:DinB family protein n=1 Tax=Pedobacter sp. BS3 TaxID=2567937 RepID=UPI0011EBC44F|nr:DinB family protein [Pedobacter sp. BS3]TZF84475.1 DinB family protein [Pedobacter sp. BS3]